LIQAWDEIQDQRPQDVRDALAREHQAQSRPDLGRVHPSWWARALQDEPVSVRATVIAHLPGELQGALPVESRLGLSEARADRPPRPFAVQAVMTLWRERLIGDVPERPDDPPVIVALSRLQSGEIAELIRTVGQAKRAMTSRETLDLFDRLRDRLGDLDPRASLIAQRDVQTPGQSGPRSDFRIGLLSFARLLRISDPYRTRWALQQIPYPTARSIRRLMEREPPRTPMLTRWETQFLRAAWRELNEAGRIPEPWTWENTT
ncbi:MAG: hypothetical protein AB7I30_03800, partial [Isosphaeraceae bacterium]